MLRDHLPFVVNAILGVALCLSLLPSCASADPADVVTLPTVNVIWEPTSCTVTGGAVCFGSFQIGTTIQYDPDTMTATSNTEIPYGGFFFESVSEAASPKGPILTFSFGICCGFSGGFSLSYYENPWQYVPDSDSGFGQLVFGNSFVGVGFENYEVIPTPTPEPSPLLLFGTGLLGLGPLVRRFAGS